MAKLDFLRPDFEFTVHTSAGRVRLRVEQIDYDPDIEDAIMQVIGRLVSGKNISVEETADGIRVRKSDGYHDVSRVEMHDPASWSFDV